LNNAGGIAFSAAWILAGLASLFPVILIPMMFDAPGSEANPLVFALAAAIAAFPVFCFAGAILPWVFRRRSFAKRLFLLPALDIVMIVLAFFALDYFCHGMFSCS
jgi:hypothetical protein